MQVALYVHLLSKILFKIEWYIYSFIYSLYT